MRIEITYSPAGDTAYIQLSQSEVRSSVPLTDDVTADYTYDGRLVGIELTTASNVFDPVANRG